MSLVDIGGIKIPYQNGMALPNFEKQKRIIIDLAGAWKKQRFNAADNITLAKRDAAGYTNLMNEAVNRHQANFDDSGWETKQLPAVENKMNVFPQPPELLPNSSQPDGVWYRKTFQVDAGYEGKFVKLIFYAVNYVADVWLNGQYLGYHEGGYTPFAFNVSSKINFGGNNTLAVRVDNPEWGKRNDIVPFVKADWFNYTGILHDVYIEVSDPVSVIRTNIVPLNLNGDLQTTVVVSNKSSSSKNVSLSIEIFNTKIDQTNIASEYATDLAGDAAQFSILNQEDLTIPADSVAVLRTGIKISAPKIWTPKEPNLYVMKVTLSSDGKIVDEYFTQFGIRTIGTQGNKFLLNERVVFLPGSARHEDHPVYGRSIPKEIIYSDLQTVKSLNINFLRTAHYPNHLFTYLIADRLGISIMEEIPVYWFNNTAEWQIQNNQRHIHQQMFREMIFRDYNRPSILLWSTSNECKEVTYRSIYNARLRDDLKTNFPDGRLITQSPAGDQPGPADPTQAFVDVAGWTLYFGVFHGNTRPEYAFSGTFGFLNSAKNNFPDKPILDTEFGYWSTENPNSQSYQAQTYIFDETFKAFKYFANVGDNGQLNPNGGLMATTWWAVFDWYQYKDTYNSYQTMGLITMDRKTQKPVATNLKLAYSPYYNLDGILVGVQNEKEEIPSGFYLHQNYPNPFNPETVISYRLSAFSKVNLKIFDVLGREVATLVDEYQQPGVYNSQFAIINYQLSSGVYFYQLRAIPQGGRQSIPQSGRHAENYFQTKKMIILK
ncbi:MAG: glycoside hydrolase family 2 TIM barrel-domain containing protein, partial [Bacteroidota bacterium]